MSRAWAGGSSRHWRKVRMAVLERDGYQCQIKIPGVCQTVATQAHHILGKATTGDDPDYCVAACRACNVRVGMPESTPDPPPRSTTW